MFYLLEGTQFFMFIRQKVKFYHDKHVRLLPELEIGQEVRVAPLRKNRTREQGICTEKLSDRSCCGCWPWCGVTTATHLAGRCRSRLVLPCSWPRAQLCRCCLQPHAAPCPLLGHVAAGRATCKLLLPLCDLFYAL